MPKCYLKKKIELLKYRNNGIILPSVNVRENWLYFYKFVKNICVYKLLEGKNYMSTSYLKEKIKCSKYWTDGII